MGIHCITKISIQSIQYKIVIILHKRLIFFLTEQNTKDSKFCFHSAMLSTVNRYLWYKASYVCFRLHIGKKLPASLSTFCISAHITKTVAALLYVYFKSQQLNIINYVLLFWCIAMVTRVFVNEVRPDVTIKQVHILNIGHFIFKK